MRFRATVFAAPHRAMFLAGTLQALVAMAFWVIELGARSGFWLPVSWPLFTLLPPIWWHATVMTAGVLAFFVFGFILTAGPRWQGYGDLPKHYFLPAFGLLSGGWLLVWAALWWPLLLVAGLMLVLTGWLAVATSLTVIARRPAAERQYIALSAAAVWAGAAGLAAFLGFAVGGDPALARAGIGLLLWGFLLPMFLIVTHRMLPFFTASALPGYVSYQPRWALRGVLAASLSHGLLDFLELRPWLWCVDLPAACVMLHLTWRWWESRVAGQRMLAVLHIAFGWCGLAFLLFAGQSLLWTMWPGILGLAPVHALTLGYFSAMLVGMISRVTLGHAGRRVVPDAAMWQAFWLMQAGALLRVASDLPAIPAAQSLLLASGALWFAAFSIWTVRYAPDLWRPRIDGRPG